MSTTTTVTAAAPTTSVQTVIDFIHGEMVRNAGGPQVAAIRDRLKVLQWDNLIPGKYGSDVGAAMGMWYELVKTGGLWDHKAEIISRFGKWSLDAVRRMQYEYDIWSNIHYGYVGLAAGFGEWVLEAGAGVAQLKANTMPPGYWERRFERIGDADAFSAMDDPKDQAAIKLGFALWKAHGKSVSAVDILTAVRHKVGSLATKPA